MFAKNNSDVITADIENILPPRAPRTFNETGIPFLFLFELLVKVMFLRGQIRLFDISSHIKLTANVLDPILVFMRSEQLCEVTRRGGSGTDADITYNLTDLGRSRATEFIRRNAYTGPAPVTLADYCLQINNQSHARKHISREAVIREYSNVVVNSFVLDQLGSGMNSRKSMFIHGPAGSGKTYLAERLASLLNGSIFVPHAIVVDNQVIQIYDPSVHKIVLNNDPSNSVVNNRTATDERWVQCTRPAVLMGGELTLDMLDLRFDEGTRFYQAPPHLKANNGIFIIDDLGRQRCSVEEIMNRWIVPLDRQIDYLTLHTGYKFLVPFNVIVVFSANFPPEKLVDGALLRRIGYKIHVGELSEKQYERIFKNVCEELEVTYADEAFQYLLINHHYKENRALLACYPRDILSQIKDLALYEGGEPILDERTLKWAWNNYFVGA